MLRAIFLSILFLSVSTQTIFAQEPSTYSTESMPLETRQQIERLENAHAVREQKINEARERSNLLRESTVSRLVERFNSMLINVNSRWVERWRNLLTRLDVILDKMQTRIERMAQLGIDVSSLNVGVESIQEDLLNIETAISAQEQKEYMLTGSEENLPEAAMALKEQMRSDHQIIRSMLREVHGDMKEVVSKMKELWKEYQDENDDQ